MKALKRLRWTIGAAALFSACTIHFKSDTSFTDDSLLQRMLVAEDARGTGAEGLAPLLEGEKSSDSTLHAVAVRGLARLKDSGLKSSNGPATSTPAQCGDTVLIVIFCAVCETSFPCFTSHQCV